MSKKGLFLFFSPFPLVGYLMTFELSINERFEKKNKIIAFVSNTEDEEEDCHLDTNGGI